MKLYIPPLEKHLAVYLSPAFLMCAVAGLWWDLLHRWTSREHYRQHSPFSQNLQRAEMFFLIRSRGSLDCEIWKGVSSSWAVPLLQHKVLAFLTAWQTWYGKFLAFICVGGVRYIKWLIMSLKLHRAELVVELMDMTVKTDASSLVSD